MSESCRPEGMPWLVAYLMVQDVAKTADFYQKAFGFQLLELSKDEHGQAFHAELKYHDQVVMIGKEGSYGCEVMSPKTSKAPCPIKLYLYCENVDGFYAHAVDQGAISLNAPEDAFWGDRYCCIQDIDGYDWSFGTHKK